MSHTREIKRLISEIPTDFPCIPGCTDCCDRHAWTRVEWKQVNPKLRAAGPNAKCPYATEEGCSCYDKRPVICRMYGNAGEIGSFFPFWNISLACPRGIQPVTPLSREQARGIFSRYIKILQAEKPSGPYAAFVGRL